MSSDSSLSSASLTKKEVSILEKRKLLEIYFWFV
jgi:hypothetical protein